MNDRSVCARWADVAAGKYDARWTEIAQEIKDFGYTIHLGYHHEMTNDTGTTPRAGRRRTTSARTTTCTTCSAGWA